MGIVNSVMNSSEQCTLRTKFVEPSEIRFHGGRYIFESVVGKGGFGIVACVRDEAYGDFSALKIVPNSKHCDCMNREIEVMEILNGVNGIPKIYGDWTEKECKIIRMELVGSNLNEYTNALEKSLMPTDIYEIASQMIDVLKEVHDKGFVHCDVKPSNFAFGIGENKRKLYLLDFGLTERYIDHNGKHTEEIQRHPRGTHIYMSINQHERWINSRRDDMESVVYSLMEICNIPFPWRHIQKKGSSTNHTAYYNAKLEFVSFVSQFDMMLKMCRQLDFTAKPDYEGMKKIFKPKLNFPFLKKPSHPCIPILVHLNNEEKQILARFDYTDWKKDLQRKYGK